MGRFATSRRIRAAVRAMREASFHPLPTQEAALRNLRGEMPVAPVAVDVGANVGRWTKALLASHPDARILMVEAQAELMPVLRRIASSNPKVVAVHATLSSAEAERTFYICHGDRHRSGSSLLPELTGLPLEERVVTTTTLDSVVASFELDRAVDFVKLDTQGSELEILEGASQTLQGAQLVQLEVSLVPYNEGAPVLAEVVAYMDDHGFVARDIFDLIYPADSDSLVQFNCVFSRHRRSLSDLT